MSKKLKKAIVLILIITCIFNYNIKIYATNKIEQEGNKIINEDERIENENNIEKNKEDTNIKNELTNEVKNTESNDLSNNTKTNSLLEDDTINNTNSIDGNNIIEDTKVINTADNNIISSSTEESENDISTQSTNVTALNYNLVNLQKGVYKLAVGASSEKTVEVAGSDTGENAKVDIWNYGNVPAQKFNIELQDDGYYKITARHTGKSLTVKNGDLKEGSEVVQATYKGLDSQKWIIRDSNINGLVISLLANPDLSIAIKGNISNGAILVLEKTEYNNNQMFYIFNVSESESPVQNGIYSLTVGANPDKAMEIAGNSTNENAEIDIGDYSKKPAPQFNIEYNSEGYYKITSRKTGKSLTVKEGNLKEGGEIVQATYEGLNSQKWIIRDSNINGLVISLLSNPQLSIAIKGNITDGSKLVLAKSAYNDNQMFYMFNENGKETPLQNGVYRLAVGASSKKAVEVAGSDIGENAKIDIWDYGNATAQKFNIELQDGYYKITARHTGKSLTVKDGKLKEGAEIVQATYEGLDSQKWILRDSNVNGLVISLIANPDLSIAIKGNISNGAKLILAETEYNDNQMFYIYNEKDSERPVQDGEYRLAIGANSTKTVEVAGSDTAENAKIGIWDYGNAEAQKFNIEYNTEGYYKITAKHTGKSLTVKDGNLKEGTEIVQATYEGLDSQKWIIKDSNINGLVISLLSNPQLSIAVEGDIENGAKMILAKTEYNDNQMLYFFKTKITIVLNAGHGGSSTGCAHGSIVEKNVTLYLARKIRDNLSRFSNVNVILSRDGDYDMDLAVRAMVARNNNADLYMSLHINDESSHSAVGSQMYVPFYEGAKKYNSNMERLANMIQTNLRAIGIRDNISGGIVKRNIDTIPKYQYLMDGEVVQADYYADIRCAMKGDTLDYGSDLNTNTGVPAILVEHCFMNSSDVRFLDSNADLDKIANADSQAIINYFNLN